MGQTGWQWENPQTGNAAGTALPASSDVGKLQFFETKVGQPVPWCYGRHLVAGAPILQNKNDDGNTILLVALGEGEWDALEMLWVNGKAINVADTSIVHFHPGLDGEVGAETIPGTRNQKVCSFFPAGLTGTTFSRTAYIAFKLAPDPTAPSADFDVRGIYRTRRVRLFDRLGNQTGYTWSANPAWQLLDAYISLHLKPYGVVNEALTAAEKARINFSAFFDAAAYCDQDIGTGKKRFESHVAFVDNTNLGAVFETLLALCRGYLLEQDERLRLYIDQPRASIFTFDADNILQFSLSFSEKDTRGMINQLVVKIRDLESGGSDHAKDFAPWQGTLNDEGHQDFIGRIIKKEFDLGANTRERAERLGKYWMQRSLLRQHATMLATLDAGKLLPGDVITAPRDHTLTAARDWEILESTDNADGGRELFLQEYDPTIFGEAVGAQQAVEETSIPLAPLVPSTPIDYIIHTGKVPFTGGGTIAAPPTGAVRNANVVTITTTTPHNLQVSMSVWIQGIIDGSFNGTFFITEVPSTTSFKYAQTGPNTTSGNGTAAANWYSYRRVLTTIYDVLAGDELHLDVFIDPKSPAPNYGLDFEYGPPPGGTGKTARDDSDLHDQNGVWIHPGAAQAAWAQGQWYHRIFKLDALAGQRISSWASAWEGNDVGTYKGRLANIKIVNGVTIKAFLFSSDNLGETPVWGPGGENYSEVTITSAESGPNLDALFTQSRGVRIVGPLTVGRLSDPYFRSVTAYYDTGTIPPGDYYWGFSSFDETGESWANGGYVTLTQPGRIEFKYTPMGGAQGYYVYLGASPSTAYRQATVTDPNLGTYSLNSKPNSSGPIPPTENSTEGQDLANLVLDGYLEGMPLSYFLNLAEVENSQAAFFYSANKGIVASFQTIGKGGSPPSGGKTEFDIMFNGNAAQIAVPPPLGGGPSYSKELDIFIEDVLDAIFFKELVSFLVNVQVASGKLFSLLGTVDENPVDWKIANLAGVLQFDLGTTNVVAISATGMVLNSGVSLKVGDAGGGSLEVGGYPFAKKTRNVLADAGGTFVTSIDFEAKTYTTADVWKSSLEICPWEWVV